MAKHARCPHPRRQLAHSHVRDQDFEDIGDRPLSDRQPPVHIGFAESELWPQSDGPRCPLPVKPYGRPRATRAEDTPLSIRPDKNQRAVFNEFGKKDAEHLLPLGVSLPPWE